MPRFASVMRILLFVAAILASTASSGVVFGAPAAAPTPTASPTAAPTQKSASPAPARATPVGNRAPATQSPKPTQPPALTPTKVSASHVDGFVFHDANGDGVAGDDEAGLPDVEVRLEGPNGLKLAKNTDPDGAFAFDGLAAGSYKLSVVLPDGLMPTTNVERTVELDGRQIVQLDSRQGVPVLLGLAESPPADTPTPVVAEEPAQAGPEATETPAADAPQAAEDSAAAELLQAATLEPEQVAAFAAVVALPLRFAEGRDLMAQIQKRLIGDGVLWLGVPFHTQIDGSEFQFVNCGPASLTMVLSAFGLDVEPAQVRAYLNALTDNFDRDSGTSLHVLSGIAKQAGLTSIDLYSDRGGYRDWSVEAVRWHVQQGHPVITLVKYSRLPGHFQSSATSDHYIVVSGLTPTGFIYNDAAFQSTLGYGLEISDEALEQAWDNSSIPHHAAAFALAGAKGTLSFPEMPRPTATSEPWYPPSTAQYANRPVDPAPAPQAEAPADPPEPVAPPTPILSMTGALTADGLDDEADADGAFAGLEVAGPAGLVRDDARGIAHAGGSATIAPRVVVLGGSLLLAWTLLRLGAWLLLRALRLRPSWPPALPRLRPAFALFSIFR